MRRIAEKGANTVGLALLDVEQEHVGRVGRHLQRELTQQAGLQRSHPDDEESPEADREQDDACLVARTRQVQHRVAQRKRPRVRHRRNQRDQRATRQMKNHRQRREPHAHHDPDLERGRLPGGQRDQRQRHHDDHRDPQPVAAAPHALVAQQQRRFDEPHLQQRHHRKQQRDQHADRHALQGRAPADAVMGLRQNRGRRPQHQRDRGEHAAGHGDAQQAAGQPQRHHLQDVDRDDLPTARAKALQDRDATYLLQDEHTRHARDRDPAENDDDQADQAQVVLGAIEVAPDLVLGRSERSGVDEVVLEVLAQRLDQRIDPGLGHLDQHGAAGAAAEPEQAGRRRDRRRR